MLISNTTVTVTFQNIIMSGTHSHTLQNFVMAVTPGRTFKSNTVIGEQKKENINRNIIVSVPGLSTYVPSIHPINEAESKPAFRTQHHTSIDSKSTFLKIQQPKRGLARNALMTNI